MANPKLRQIESWFWQSIAAAPGDCDFVRQLVAEIEPSRTLDSAQRLQIYSDAYLLRLRGVLAEDFPRVAKLLGEENFDRLVRDYLKSHPSTEPSVHCLGGALAKFIGRREGIAPWMADLARLEWARVGAFDAPDDEPLTVAQLSRTDPAQWPQLRLIPVRSLEVVEAAWPIHRTWAEQSPEGLEPIPTSIRVWRRPDYKVAHAPMDEHETVAAGRLIAHSTFGEICQVFDALEEQEGAAQAGALLLRWLEDGIIARAEPQ
jgi:hypothetical protein